MWLLSKKRGEIILSKYVIIHGQLCELPEDELMHWKYIKRERKNGRWVYTYDLKQNVKDKIGVTAKENMNKYKSQYDQQRERIDRNARYTSFHKWRKEDSAMDKKISAYKLQDSTNKLNASKKVQARNEEIWSRARDKMDNPGKVSKPEWNMILKKDDKTLGAKVKSDEAVEKAERKRNSNEHSLWFDNHMLNEHSKAYNETNAAVIEDIKSRGEAGKKYVEARNEYLNTPLGKLETASKKIEARVDSAKDYVHELVTNERGKKARDEMRSAQFDLRNALAKEDSHRKRYEEVLAKTRNQEYFDKDHGNTAMVNEWKKDFDDARKESKAALERAIQAREAYESTPMGKRERREYEKNKRKKR